MENYDPKPYLECYGYLWYTRGNVEAGASVNEILKLAIRTYQDRDGPKVSGEIDDETIESMNTARCDNLEFGGGNSVSLYYISKPKDFDPKKFLEAFRFFELAQAHLFKDNDGDGASKEDILELAVKKFQQTYGLRVTGKFEDKETMVLLRNSIVHFCSGIIKKY